MQSINTSCTRCVGAPLGCKYCGYTLIKYGATTSGKQRYFCRSCSRTQISCYTYRAYKVLDVEIVRLTKEGLGIRSTSRVLQISVTTLSKRIKNIADRLYPPVVNTSAAYEVDELHTYIGDKSRAVWIVYALERDTGSIVGFNIGNRSVKTIVAVIHRLALLSAQCIYTDQLSHYRSIVPKSIHKVTPYGTNHIERKNLTLRTHLKRLSRRTICFSKSAVMLAACLKIYFWG